MEFFSEVKKCLGNFCDLQVTSCAGCLIEEVLEESANKDPALQTILYPLVVKSKQMPLPGVIKGQA